MVHKVSAKPVGGRTKTLPQRAVSLPLPKKRKARKVPGKAKKTGRIRARHVPDRKRGKILITDNTKKLPVVPSATKVIVRSNLELALLSPFRFPLPQERTIAGVARYAGVFFVLVGGFFSLLNLDYATGTLATVGESENQAQVIDGTQTTTSGAEGTAGTVVPLTTATPDVRITIEGQTTTLKNVAVLTVNVPYATEVKLIVERKSDGMLVPLGSAFPVDSSTWRFYVETRQYPDGEYRFRVAVKNSYGSYEHRDSTWRLIDNLPDAEANQTATTESTATPSPLPESTNVALPESTTTVATDEGAGEIPPPITAPAPGATLRVLESSPLSGGAPIEVQAVGAVKVKVYARHTGSGTLYYAGEAVRNGKGLWELRWDTEKVPDGVYVLRARAELSPEASVESSLVERTVKNGIVPQVLVGTTTVNTATTTGETQTAPPVAEAVFTPTITLKVAKLNPVSGFVDVSLGTSPVLSAELYAVPKGSLTPRFLGLARKVSSTEWTYTWQTTQSPNGDYELYARVKTEYGFTEGKRVSVRVLNQVVETFTEKEETAIDALRRANDELVTITDKKPDEADAVETPPVYVPPKVVYVESVATFIANVEAPEEERRTIESVLTEFRKRLSGELSRLARAEREGNEDELRRVKESIEDLRADVIRELRTGVARREILDRIDGYLAEVTNELRDITLKNERVLKERVGEAIAKDSDKDGITDYDEVNIYRTNPFSADTDGDSYIDSVEVKLGYDPVNPKNETLITYESPKDVGTVREDLLTVETVTTLAPTAEDETSESGEAKPRALISGRGLPNSFVTLYIFSTPIVLTVKTDAEGAWSYVFDKELEEGAHEVYVGITDNAGRIVAKSAPLPFVKTAVAFTETEVAGAPIEVSPEPNLIDERMMLLVASIAIVGLGLVLILLGLHVRGREEPQPTLQTT